MDGGGGGLSLCSFELMLVYLSFYLSFYLPIYIGLHICKARLDIAFARCSIDVVFELGFVVSSKLPLHHGGGLYVCRKSGCKH